MKKLELQVPPTIDFSDHTSPLSDLSPDIRSNCSISQETSELSEKFLERAEECEPGLPMQSNEIQNENEHFLISTFATATRTVMVPARCAALVDCDVPEPWEPGTEFFAECTSFQIDTYSLRNLPTVGRINSEHMVTLSVLNPTTQPKYIHAGTNLAKLTPLSSVVPESTGVAPIGPLLKIRNFINKHTETVNNDLVSKCLFQPAKQPNWEEGTSENHSFELPPRRSKEQLPPEEDSGMSTDRSENNCSQSTPKRSQRRVKFPEHGDCLTIPSITESGSVAVSVCSKKSRRVRKRRCGRNQNAEAQSSTIASRARAESCAAVRGSAPTTSAGMPLIGQGAPALAETPASCDSRASGRRGPATRSGTRAERSVRTS